MWSDLYTHRGNSYRDHSQLEKVGLQYSHIFGHSVVYLTLERDKLIPQSSGLEVIKLFSSSAWLSMRFQLLINVEIVKISGNFRFNTQQLVINPAHKC